ncbi:MULTISPECIES: putative transporter [Muribaculum]|uniref:Putative transporter n=2 Tax=Muribaculum TaxID=1918540 RepID=A0A4P7VQ02_9BACT|nr:MULTISPECIES: putative transporter [Muribaculum]MCX4277183.1 putative transporter [Muribaculum sp.]QCD36378.1 putative transporter [Muribaculum gordoncarteri]
MDWINLLLIEHSSLQAIVIVSLICAIGMALGKVKIAGISLGVTFVFFIGIIAGHIGLSIDPAMLKYAENFGLVIFVYALGLQVGPGFFSSLAHGGVKLNVLGLSLALITLITAIALTYVTPVSIPDMMGLFCGATTNTPALGAVQQTLSQLGIPSSTPALGCAVTYPLGVVGVIIAVIIMRKLFIKPNEISDAPIGSLPKPKITEFEVSNPGIYGKTIEEIARLSNCHFVISRLWHNGTVSIPTSSSRLEAGDRLLVVSTPDDVEALHIVFGEQDKTDWNANDIDWNTVDRQLVSQPFIVTRRQINGKTLGSLRLRNLYGVNISRVYRSGLALLATPDLRLQLGDKIIVVGEQKAIDKIEPMIGNTINVLNEPNLFAVFIGIVLGIALGSIPFHFPGIGVPISIGLAGGPIIMGILVGTFGPRLHMVTYTTTSANLMLRAIGLALYLACLGLESGAHFFETVFRSEGLLWILLGMLLTIVPVLILGLFTVKVLKFDFGTTTGMLCGSMANPMALDYANSILPGDHQSIAYATVYPLSMFARVILVQIVILALM